MFFFKTSRSHEGTSENTAARPGDAVVPMKTAGLASPLRRVVRQVHWRLVLYAGVVLALGLAAVLLPWHDVFAAMRAARVSWLLAAVALNIAVFPLWVLQWRMLAAPVARVPWRIMVGVVSLSVIAKVSLSGLAGVSSGLLALRYRAGLNYSQATAVISVDQFLALLTKLVVVVLALALLPLPAAVYQAAAGLAGLVLLLLGILPLMGQLGQRAGVLWTHLSRFRRDLSILGARRVLAGGLALALLKKALEAAAALAVQLACGIDAPVAAAVLVVAAVSLTTLIPIMPANLGAHSAGVFVAYAVLGIPADQAIAAGLLHHATVLAASVVIAVAGLWMARK